MAKMDLAQDLSRLQKRMEMYEDKISTPDGNTQINQQMLQHYTVETSKVREKVLAGAILPTGQEAL